MQVVNGPGNLLKRRSGGGALEAFGTAPLGTVRRGRCAALGAQRNVSRGLSRASPRGPDTVVVVVVVVVRAMYSHLEVLPVAACDIRDALESHKHL